MRQQTEIARDLLRMHKFEAQSQHKLHLVHEVAEELGLLEYDDSEIWPGDLGLGEGLIYSSISIYGDAPTIQLVYQDRHGVSVSFQLSTKEGATALAVAAKHLLPKVGRFDKNFNAEQRKVQLTATYRGVQIVLESSPPSTCTVEEVEEEVVIPAKPAEPERVEKRKRYVMKGDCDPLIGPTPKEIELPLPCPDCGSLDEAKLCAEQSQQEVSDALLEARLEADGVA